MARYSKKAITEAGRVFGETAGSGGSARPQRDDTRHIGAALAQDNGIADSYDISDYGHAYADGFFKAFDTARKTREKSAAEEQYLAEINSERGAHSDKGLMTLRLLGSKPSLCRHVPLKRVVELKTADVPVSCAVCNGFGKKRIVADLPDKFRGKARAAAEAGYEYVYGNGAAYQPDGTRVEEYRGYVYHVPCDGGCKPFKCWFDPTAVNHADGGRVGEMRRCEKNESHWGLLKSCTWPIAYFVPQWTEGAKFSTSRYALADCQLCGKRIPSGEFAPVEATSQDGTVHALWLGLDCARKIRVEAPKLPEGGQLVK